MAFHEDIILADPVLERVFFDTRRFAPMPGHDAIVNTALYAIAALMAPFLNARTVEGAEKFVDGYSHRGRYCHGIRHYYFLARRHSEGYYLDTLADQVGDDCEHVGLFAHERDDAIFNIDYQARAAYRYRYKHRPNLPARRRPGRARSV